MSLSRPPRNSGFVVTLTLLLVATFGLVLLVAWQQRQAAVARRVEQQLRIRLERELHRELERLDSAMVTGPGTTASQPPRPALRRRALDNLLRQGRNEQLALERRRQELKQILRRSTRGRRREVLDELRRLDSGRQWARSWVRLLESQVPESRPNRAPPFSSPAAVEALPGQAASAAPARQPAARPFRRDAGGRPRSHRGARDGVSRSPEGGRGVADV